MTATATSSRAHHHSIRTGTIRGAVLAIALNVVIRAIGNIGSPVRVVTGWAPDGADLSLVEVVITTLVAVAIGGALLAWMQRGRDRFPAWVTVVAAVAVLSAVPLWRLDVDTASKATLTIMHLTTGATAVAAHTWRRGRANP